MVLIILKNISQWEGLSHILWKNINCSKPNHQQDKNLSDVYSWALDTNSAQLQDEVESGKGPSLPRKVKAGFSSSLQSLGFSTLFFFGFANGGPPILHQLYSNSHGKTMINIDKSWDGMEQV